MGTHSAPFGAILPGEGRMRLLGYTVVAVDSRNAVIGVRPRLRAMGAEGIKRGYLTVAEIEAAMSDLANDCPGGRLHVREYWRDDAAQKTTVRTYGWDERTRDVRHPESMPWERRPWVRRMMAEAGDRKQAASGDRE